MAHRGRRRRSADVQRSAPARLGVMIVLAFGGAAGVGIPAGVGGTNQAAALEPASALRYE